MDIPKNKTRPTLTRIKTKRMHRLGEIHQGVQLSGRNQHTDIDARLLRNALTIIRVETRCAQVTIDLAKFCAQTIPP